jgi:replicative DNA helicase
LQIASHLAIDLGVSVGYFSLESSRSELLERLYANQGKIASQAIATGKLQMRDFNRIQDISSKIYESKFFIHDTANQKLSMIQSIARKMLRTGKIQIMFLDYLQLIQVPNTKDRREQVEKASLAMKQLSRDLNIPVVVAAQLRRDSESRIPNLADFQHSSQLEQDADVAMLLNVDKDENKWLLIAKNRDGERGRVKLSFTGQYLHFTEVDRRLEYLEKLSKKDVV